MRRSATWLELMGLMGETNGNEDKVCQIFNSYKHQFVPRWGIKGMKPKYPDLDDLTCFCCVLKFSYAVGAVSGCLFLYKPIKEHPWSLKLPTFHFPHAYVAKPCKGLWRVSFIHEPKKKHLFHHFFFFRNRFCSILRRFCLQKQQGCPTQKRYKSLQCWFTNQRNIPSTIDHWGGDFQKLDFIPEGILALGYYLWLWFVSQAVILRWMFPHDPARIFHRLCGMAFCRYEMQSSTLSHLVIARVPNL